MLTKGVTPLQNIFAVFEGRGVTLLLTSFGVSSGRAETKCCVRLVQSWLIYYQLRKDYDSKRDLTPVLLAACHLWS